MEQGGRHVGRAGAWGELTAGLLGWFLGCSTVYGVLFGTGFLLYDRLGMAVISLAVGLASGVGILRLLPRTALLR